MEGKERNFDRLVAFQFGIRTGLFWRSRVERNLKLTSMNSGTRKNIKIW